MASGLVPKTDITRKVMSENFQLAKQRDCWRDSQVQQAIGDATPSPEPQKSPPAFGLIKVAARQFDISR